VQELWFTGCHDRWDKLIKYWCAYKNTKKGENFWCKVVSVEKIPFAALALFMTDESMF